MLRPNASQGEMLMVGRIAVVGIAVLATVLALNPDSSVLEMVAYGLGRVRCCFWPQHCCSHFTGRE